MLLRCCPALRLYKINLGRLWLPLATASAGSLEKWRFQCPERSMRQRINCRLTCPLPSGLPRPSKLHLAPLAPHTPHTLTPHPSTPLSRIRYQHLIPVSESIYYCHRAQLLCILTNPDRRRPRSPESDMRRIPPLAGRTDGVKVKEVVLATFAVVWKRSRKTYEVGM